MAASDSKNKCGTVRARSAEPSVAINLPWPNIEVERRSSLSFPTRNTAIALPSYTHAAGTWTKIMEKQRRRLSSTLDTRKFTNGYGNDTQRRCLGGKDKLKDLIDRPYPVPMSFVVDMEDEDGQQEDQFSNHSGSSMPTTLAVKISLTGLKRVLAMTRDLAGGPQDRDDYFASSSLGRDNQQRLPSEKGRTMKDINNTVLSLRHHREQLQRQTPSKPMRKRPPTSISRQEHVKILNKALEIASAIPNERSAKSVFSRPSQLSATDKDAVRRECGRSSLPQNDRWLSPRSIMNFPCTQFLPSKVQHQESELSDDCALEIIRDKRKFLAVSRRGLVDRLQQRLQSLLNTNEQHQKSMRRLSERVMHLQCQAHVKKLYVANRINHLKRSIAMAECSQGQHRAWANVRRRYSAAIVETMRQDISDVPEEDREELESEVSWDVNVAISTMKTMMSLLAEDTSFVKTTRSVVSQCRTRITSQCEEMIDQGNDICYNDFEKMLLHYAVPLRALRNSVKVETQIKSLSIIVKSFICKVSTVPQEIGRNRDVRHISHLTWSVLRSVNDELQRLDDAHNDRVRKMQQLTEAIEQCHRSEGVLEGLWQLYTKIRTRPSSKRSLMTLSDDSARRYGTQLEGHRNGIIRKTCQEVVGERKINEPSLFKDFCRSSCDRDSDSTALGGSVNAIPLYVYVCNEEHTESAPAK